MRCGVHILGAPALCRLILLLSHACDVMFGHIDEVLQWRSGHKETGSLHGDDKVETPCSNFLYFRSISTRNGVFWANKYPKSQLNAAERLLR